MTNKTCQDCKFWHKGYLLQGYKMPATCNKEPFAYAKNDDPACKDFEEKVNQTELLKESKAFRQSIGLGDKRSIKWLQSFAKKGMWQYEKVASQNNSIFYCINDKVKNQPNLPNDYKKEIL